MPVLSADTLKSVSDSYVQDDKSLIKNNTIIQPKKVSAGSEEFSSSCMSCNSSLVLAGLHACGDLSVTMLRTFLESDQVNAVVSIGCCYNLLSEEASSPCGFLMSKGVKSAGFALGRSAHDLACQSAERWRCIGNVAGLHTLSCMLFALLSRWCFFSITQTH